MPDEVHLELTVAELNSVLSALGQRPFAEVYELIGRIQLQARQQVATEDPAAEQNPATTLATVGASDDG